jgi:Mrp family chromosome partitioning ATPase
MSRNFELMQLAGRGAEFGAQREVRDAELKAGHRNATDCRDAEGVAQQDQSGLDLDQLAREESLRLVQRIFLPQTQDAARMVVFAGIDHGNGCSRLCVRTAETLVSNVAGSICLVDANLRSPSLPELYGTTNHHGLTDALLQTGPIRSFAKPLRNQRLWLLSCGSLAVDSPSLLNSNRLKDRLAELRKEFDYVLIDAPPLTRYADAIAFGKLTDGLVLILEANLTRREVALTIAENLRGAGIRILGAVLNKRTFPIPERLYHLL